MAALEVERQGGMLKGDILRAIEAGDTALRAEFQRAMAELSDKLDKIDRTLTLLVGEPETPGVLTRVEAKLEENHGMIERVESKQIEAKANFDARVQADDEFRKTITKQVAAVEARLKILEVVFVVAKMLIKTGKALGDSPRTLKLILGGVFWIMLWQFMHTVRPALELSFKTRHWYW